MLDSNHMKKLRKISWRVFHSYEYFRPLRNTEIKSTYDSGSVTKPWLSSKLLDHVQLAQNWAHKWTGVFIWISTPASCPDHTDLIERIKRLLKSSLLHPPPGSSILVLTSLFPPAGLQDGVWAGETSKPVHHTLAKGAHLRCLVLSTRTPPISFRLFMSTAPLKLVMLTLSWSCLSRGSKKAPVTRIL